MMNCDNNASDTVTLNPDVLTLVLESIDDKTDLFVAIPTGHIVYDGFRWRTNNPSQDDLRSVHAFMASRTPSSFKALDTLDLRWIRYLSEDDAVLLKNLLDKGIRHVETLKFPYDDPFARHEELLEPITSLRNLQSVSSDRNSSAVQRFVLPRLRSPLTQIYLCLDDNENVLPLIANFTSTLEIAEIVGIALWTQPLCFSKLTHLGFYGPLIPNLPLLVAVFPNVRTLGLGDEEYSNYSGLYDTPSNYDIDTPTVNAIRILNIQFQKHDRYWEHLEDVSIASTALYATAFQMRAKSLEVPWLCDGLHGEDMPWLLSSLERIRPEHLTLAVSDADALAKCLSKGCENVNKLKLTMTVLD